MTFGLGAFIYSIVFAIVIAVVIVKVWRS